MVRKNFTFNVIRSQEKVASSDRFEDDKIRLSQEKNDEGVYICKGRLEVFCPIYLPHDPVLSKKVNFVELKKSLNRGVAMAMIIFLDTTFKTLFKVRNEKLLWI